MLVCQKCWKKNGFEIFLPSLPGGFRLPRSSFPTKNQFEVMELDAKIYGAFDGFRVDSRGCFPYSIGFLNVWHTNLHLPQKSTSVVEYTIN